MISDVLVKQINMKYLYSVWGLPKMKSKLIFINTRTIFFKENGFSVLLRHKLNLGKARNAIVWRCVNYWYDFYTGNFDLNMLSHFLTN